jgi:hypothetical protein
MRRMTSSCALRFFSSRSLLATGVSCAAIAFSSVARAEPPVHDDVAGAPAPASAPDGGAAAPAPAIESARETKREGAEKLDEQEEKRAADEERVAAARLQSTLDYYADAVRHTRTVGGVTILALGGALTGTGVYMMAANQGLATPGLLNVLVGGSFLLGGGIGLLVTSKYEELSDASHRGVDAVSVEQAWAHAAASEHSQRRLGGILAVIGGSVCFGVGALTLIDRHLWGATTDANVNLGEIYLAEGTLDILLGAFGLATEGPLESGLHTYQRSTGRASGMADALLQHVQAAPVAGGARAGFVTRF